MQVPLRLQRVTRTGTPVGLLLATGLSTAVFSATPLALPAVADRFAVGPGTAGLFSAVQLGCFVLASWVAGRVLTPDRSVFRTSVAVLAVANLASVVVGHFAVFVAVRAVAGAALGLITWLAWSQVFGDEERQGDIATVGPLAGVVVAPLLGVLLEAGDDRAVFAFLAAVGIVPLLFTPELHATTGRGGRTRSRPVPQAALLVGALTLLTLGGSAVFVFGGVIMTEELGMSPLAVSGVFALNALASVPSARWRGPRPWAGSWMLLTAGCALALGLAGEPWMAWVTLAVWGFSFWAAVPGVFTLLSSRSAHPAERAGDAQAAMAAGRALGPLLGGAVVSATSYRGLGLVGAAVVAAAGIVCVGVEARPAAVPSRHG